MVNKQVKHFYLSIYLSIKNEGKLPNLSISKQLLNYYLKPLIKGKYIVKIGYGTWQILKDFDEKEVKEMKSKQVKIMKLVDTSEVGSLIRSHAFRFKLAIPNLINWQYREDYLTKHKIAFKRSIIGQKLYFLGHKVWLSNKSVIIHEKADFIANSAKEGKNYAIDEMLRVVAKLEVLLNCSFRLNKGYKFKVTKQHHAMLKNELAKQYRKDGKKLYIADGKGFWLWADFSKAIDEKEIGNREDADRIADENIIPFYNGLKEDNAKGFTPQFVTNSLGTLIQSHKVLQEYNKETSSNYAENWKSHKQVLEEIKEAIKELTKAIHR